MTPLPTQPPKAEWGFFIPSKNVHIMLRCKLAIWERVIHAFRKHIVNQTDSEQIKVADTYSKLDATEHKQRCCHFPLTAAKFFFASTCVCTFSPHRSISCGRI